MAGKNSVVYGIYSNRTQAEAGVDRLMSGGFRKEDISVLMQDNAGTKDFATEKETKAPEGTTTGVIAGGAIGGTLGLLAGIGALAIPGIGPFIAAGPIMGALAGVGSGGVVGGIIGALVGMGIPEYEAKRYEGHIKSGGILASIHCDSGEWVSKAKDTLKQTGANEISSTSEAKADYASSDRPYPTDEPARRGTTLGLSQPTRASDDLPVNASTSSSARAVNSPGSLADDTDFRRHFESNAVAGERDYNTHAPAYHYGYQAANNAKYKGRSFDEIEPDLRSEYTSRYPEGNWEQFKDSVRYGWSKTSNRS